MILAIVVFWSLYSFLAGMVARGVMWDDFGILPIWDDTSWKVAIPRTLLGMLLAYLWPVLFLIAAVAAGMDALRSRKSHTNVG